MFIKLAPSNRSIRLNADGQILGLIVGTLIIFFTRHFTLASLEERLPENFVRIYRSSIINSDRIKEIRKSFNGSLVFVMDDQANGRIISSRGTVRDSGNVLRRESCWFSGTSQNLIMYF